jgi:hypothetical protein
MNHNISLLPIELKMEILKHLPHLYKLNHQCTTGYLYLLSQLHLISTIKPGDTLCCSQKKVVNYSSLYNILLRLYYSENRRKTLNYISTILFCAIDFFNNIQYRECNLKNNILQASVGFNNLKETYHSDNSIYKCVNLTIESINKQLNVL